MTVAFNELGESLLQDLMANIIRQQTLASLVTFQSLQKTVEGNNYTSSITNPQTGSSKDVFGNDKTKVKTSDTSRYFECENCSRKIAGARYAQHINKCLERRRR